MVDLGNCNNSVHLSIPPRKTAGITLVWITVGLYGYPLSVTNYLKAFNFGVNRLLIHIGELSLVGLRQLLKYSVAELKGWRIPSDTL